MTPLLSAALVAAQKAVDVASKDARNAHHGYDYASAEEVVAVGSAALSGAGLAFGEEGSSFDAFPVELLRRTERSDKPYPDGVGGALGMLTVVYGLVHESGERTEIRHVFPVVPEKGRPLDKALAASRTECLAYALRGLLLMQRRPKDHKRKDRPVPLDVSGRTDKSDTSRSEPIQLTPSPPPATSPTAAHASGPSGAVTGHPLRPLLQKLIAINEATKGEEALVALAAARQDRAIDPNVTEDTFLQWLLGKIEFAATLVGEAREVTLTKIDSVLARASLLPGSDEAGTRSDCAGKEGENLMASPIPLPTHGLTLLPPWSAYILFAGKRRENRAPSVACRIGRWRGLVALGCSKSFDETEAVIIARDTKAEPWFKWRGPKPFPFDTFKDWAGHIVAVADVIDVRRNGPAPSDPWAVPGQSGIILGRVWQIEPVPATGARGFYQVGACMWCGHVGSIENAGEPLNCRRCKRATSAANLGRPELKVLDIYGADGARET